MCIKSRVTTNQNLYEDIKEHLFDCPYPIHIKDEKDTPIYSGPVTGIKLLEGTLKTYEMISYDKEHDTEKGTTLVITAKSTKSSPKLSDWDSEMDEFNAMHTDACMVECYRPDLRQKQRCIASFSSDRELLILQTEDGVGIGVKVGPIINLIYDNTDDNEDDE